MEEPILHHLPSRVWCLCDGDRMEENQAWPSLRYFDVLNNRCYPAASSTARCLSRRCGRAAIPLLHFLMG